MKTGTILDYAAHGGPGHAAARAEAMALDAQVSTMSDDELLTVLVDEAHIPREALANVPRERLIAGVITHRTPKIVNKEGQPSTHPLGVLYQAPWEQDDGFGEHARRCARALSDSGVPVHLRGFGIRDAIPEIQARMKDLAHTSISRYAVQVQQAVPSDGFFQMLTTHRFLDAKEMAGVNRCRVISTMYERSLAPKADVDALNRCAQVWVACQQNRSLLEASGLEPGKARVVPAFCTEDDPLLRLQGRKRRKGPPRFYHIGKWEPRKAQDNIIKAFLLAFRPEEAELYIKTSPMGPKLTGYPNSAVDAVRVALTDGIVTGNGWTSSNVGTGVKVYPQWIPREQVQALHGLGDIYVTLSRGEGFDLPAFDAKVAGNWLIYTPSGGPQDFAATTDFPLEKTGDVPCHPFYKWQKESTYIDYDIWQAVTLMRQAAKVALAKWAPMPVSDKFSASVVGAEMRKLLEEVVGAVGGELFQRTIVP